MTSILDLVDGGGQYTVGGWAGIHPGYCIRDHCREAPYRDSAFCRDCLAWLTGECDDDPLADFEPKSKLPVPPEMWGTYALGGGVA